MGVHIPSATMLKITLLSCLLSVASANTFSPPYYSYQPLNYQPVAYPADYYGAAYPALAYNPQPYYYYPSPSYQPSFAPAYAHTSGPVYPATDRDGRIFLLETMIAYKAMSLGSSLLS